MSDAERIQLIRLCRNLVLNTLRGNYPGRMLGEKVYRIVLGDMPEYTRSLCVKDLFYLEQKGYAERRNVLGVVDKTTEWAIARWSLTAEGNEIANGLIEDSALEV